MSGSTSRLAVTLLRSRFGRSPPQTAALKSLGLRRIRQTVLLEPNAATLGNVRKVVHLVRCDEIDSAALASAVSAATKQ